MKKIVLSDPPSPASLPERSSFLPPALVLGATAGLRIEVVVPPKDVLAPRRFSDPTEPLPVFPTFAQQLVRFVSLASSDSLKKCPDCGHARHRRRTIKGPMTIDLKHPAYPIITPRVSNNTRWRWIPGVATPSYDDPNGWYLVSHEVCCDNPNCPGFETHQGVFQDVPERRGLRKYGTVRWCVVTLQSKFFPGSSILTPATT